MEGIDKRDISKDGTAVCGEQNFLPCVSLEAFPNIIFY